MTANRKWVKIVARWLARIDGVSGQLRLAFLAMTGNGIVLSTLKDYGLGDYAMPFLVISGIGMLTFAYLYTEGGVWNQVNRDRVDMSSNYSNPQQLIGITMSTKALLYALNDGEISTEEENDIEEMLEMEYERFRDGIDIDE